jgi:DNA-binding MarR family transcriptional regulator
MKKEEITPELTEQETGLLIWQVAGMWERQMKSVLDKNGLTYFQYILMDRLALLETKTRPVTQVMLANFARTDVMMTSKAVRILEEKGWIRRKKDVKDSRANQISLTDKGIKRLEKAQELVNATEDEFFGKLDSRLGQFSKNLLKLYQDHQVG